MAGTISSQTIIREARADDVPRLTAIYNHEVTRGTSNYESSPQTEAERGQWLAGLQKTGHPCLVAEREGLVIGFGSLAPFRLITGFRFTVVATLYIDERFRRAGVGKRLAAGLYEAAKQRGYHSVIAGVNSTNSPSLELLKAMGFTQVGYFKEIGCKNGQWFDDVVLQLIL